MTNKEKVRYTLRVPYNLKKLLNEEAKSRGLTLNALIITKLEEGNNEITTNGNRT